MPFKNNKFNQEAETILKNCQQKLKAYSISELKEDFERLMLMASEAEDTEHRLSLYLTAFVLGRELEARENTPDHSPKRNRLTLINGGKKT